MVAKSMQYAVCLGLAGSFAVAVAPAVRAQVQVTGGNVSGQAAFFVPTPGTGGGLVVPPLGGSTPGVQPAAGSTPGGQPAPGGTVGVQLFNVGIKQLRLETSAGNTSTAIFVPTAASFNAGSDNKPTAGDTGTFQGNLSGIAFPITGGTPVPFSNRQTVLNFSLNSFSPNLGMIDGTLISPQKAGDAALIFLPNVEATVASGSSFQATIGNLQLGDFDADLKTGAIDLPSGLILRDSTASTTLPPIALTQSIKFSFEGENVTPGQGTNFKIGGNNTGGDDDDDDNDDTIGGNTVGSNNASAIRFVGQANKNFEIQSTDTSSNTAFKIEGNVGAVDIKLSGPLSIQENGGLSSTQVVDKFKIEG
jgi:hypothetical protein